MELPIELVCDEGVINKTFSKPQLYLENKSVKLFHQIKNLSKEFSLYFDVSIRLIRSQHCEANFTKTEHICYS